MKGVNLNKTFISTQITHFIKQKNQCLAAYYKNIQPLKFNEKFKKPSALNATKTIIHVDKGCLCHKRKT